MLCLGETALSNQGGHVRIVSGVFQYGVKSLVYKYDMIKINDPKNILPELFNLYPNQFCNDPTADIVVTEPISLECSKDKLANKKLIVVDSEITPRDYKFRSNAIYCLASKDPLNLNFQCLHFQLWFLTTARANQNYQPKSGSTYLADVLLGGWSPSRYFIFEKIKSTGLMDQCLINLQSRTNNFGNPEQFVDPYYRSKQLDFLDIPGFDCCFDEQTFFTMIPVDNSNCHIFWSHIIPENIYSQSLVSIVAETENQDDVFFFTEKTAKALLGSRPFWIYSCQEALKYLKSLGFKTFSPFINEEYDDIKNRTQRLDSMMNSFIEFANRPVTQRQEILNHLSEICLHNRNFLLNKYNWIQPLVDKIITLEQV